MVRAAASTLLAISREGSMTEHVYKLVELVGTSPDSIEGAIKSAVERADETLRNLRWFEVIQIRGHVEDGGVRHYQVMLKAGFTLDNRDD
jgi:flavin-binding protein dodecin